METSTPITDKRSTNRDYHNRTVTAVSPLRRRSLLRTPSVLLESVNDEKERSSRRSLVDMQRRVSNIPAACTLNEPSKFLGEQEMKEHFQICSKLYTENKITPKNAWNLHIIDILKYIAQKPGLDSLQIAGTSLDISAKVYSIRVDDIHSEGLKLASSMSRVAHKEVPQDLDDNVAVGGEGNKGKGAAKKKKRRLLAGDKVTICKDPKTLQAPLTKLDSVFFSAKTNAESSAIDNLFTNRLKMDNSGYKFMLLNNEKAWTEEPDPTMQGVNDPSKKKYPLTINPIRSIKLCVPFSDFQQDDWDLDEEEKQLALPKPSFMENEHEVVFDDDGIPIHELDGSIHDIFETPQDDVEDDIVAVHEEVAPQARGDIAKIVDFNSVLTDATHRSEYSYNTLVPTFSGKLIDQIWAGPSHWKLKFIRRSSVKFSGQVENQAKKSKRGKKRNQHEMIDFDVEYEDFDMTNKLKIKKKPPTADFHKITLPIPDTSCAELMDHIKELMLKPGVCPVKKTPAVENQVDCEVSTYNYQNPNDSQYCSQHSNEPDVESSEPHFNDDCQNVEENGLAQQDFLGENLVDAPEAVPRSYVPYAQQAKKMDMKKLKGAIWSNLTNTANSLPKDTQERTADVVPTTFSKMFKNLPDLLPPKMQKDVSCPLAFVALLHLCNEHNLELEQLSGQNDFKIKKP